MAIIGTIRTRFLWVMLILLGVSMFLFLIMSEWESGAAILRGSKSALGTIDGTPIERLDFEEKVKQNEETFLLSKEDNAQLNEQERQSIRDQTWTEMLNKAVMSKIYEKNGLTVTTDEQTELLRGDIFADPIIKQNFTDPNTGQFNGQMVVNFVQAISQKELSPELQKSKIQWENLKKYILENRPSTKYATLVNKGIYVPKWMGDMVYSEYATAADGKVLQVPYSSIKDESVKFDDNDLKAYLNAHPKKYESKTESRGIKFAMFPVLPSKYDSADIQKWMNEKIAEFKTTENDTTFINVNSEIPYGMEWTKRSDIMGPYSDTLFSAPVGSYVGPFFDGMVYKYAKVTTRKILSDSVQYAQLSITVNKQEELESKRKLFDSLFRVLDTLGGDFTSLANTYSDDPENSIPQANNMVMKKGGFKGWATKNTVPKEVAYFLFDNDNGRYMRTVVGNSLIILKVTQTKPTTPAIKIAYLAKSLIPSKETEDGILNTVSKFAQDNQDVTKFEAALKKLPPSSVREFSVGENDHNVPGLGMARNMVKWVYSNKKGAVSANPFRVDNQYLVVMVNSIRPKGLPAVEDVKEQLKTEVIKQKKVEMISKKITDAKATTMDALAQKLNASYIPVTNVTLGQPQIGTYGYEPAVAGAMIGGKKGTISKPIEGMQGVYVILTDKLVTDSKAIPIEKSQAIAYFAQMLTRSLGQGLPQSIIESVDLEDNRSTFY